MAFTFHYVSTYTAGVTQQSTERKAFTFHYVSTYTLLTRQSEPGQDNLHSTMFLLIRKMILHDVFRFFNLHSTMFLLILVSMPATVFRSSIYIPLCFYLYQAKLNLTAGMNFIYIPLCFYLYRRRVMMEENGGEFTFHYVSTYTGIHSDPAGSPQYLHSTMFLLIPGPWIQNEVYGLNLHSTMFLLILGRLKEFVLYFQDLHSTMFLLIRSFAILTHTL